MFLRCMYIRVLGILTKSQKGGSDMTENDRPMIPEEEDVLLSSASAAEMTGLIPAGRPDKSERDSYQDVLPYFPPFGTPRPAI